MFVSGCRKAPGPEDNGGGGEPGGEKPPVEKPSYSVGELYDKGFVKGIICYVDESGEHGSVVSLQETEDVWSFKEEEVMGSNPDISGMKNTKRVYENENWRENYPGFAWCSDMNVMGLEKWYIPSGLEFYRLYLAYTGRHSGSEEAENPSDKSFNDIIEANGGVPLSNTLYWTSEEIGPQLANVFDMSTGDYREYPTELQKTIKYKFRAMADF